MQSQSQAFASHLQPACGGNDGGSQMEAEAAAGGAVTPGQCSITQPH